MKRITLFLFVLLFVTGVAYAHTSGKVEKTCPLCAHKFTYDLDSSGTQTREQFDLTPLGITVPPWPIPVCPNCHFVLYSDNITAEELVKCRDIIQSDTYRKHKDRASYYLMGLLYEGLKECPFFIGETFIIAAWQEESDEIKLKEDLELSLKNFELYLLNEPNEETKEDKDRDDLTYMQSHILKGDLLRRLARFDEARAYLINHSKNILGTEWGSIVAYEIRLCKNKDSKPHDDSGVENCEKIDSDDDE